VRPAGNEEEINSLYIGNLATGQHKNRVFLIFLLAHSSGRMRHLAEEAVKHVYIKINSDDMKSMTFHA
jgi:hypothetical protein